MKCLPSKRGFGFLSFFFFFPDRSLLPKLYKSNGSDGSGSHNSHYSEAMEALTSWQSGRHNPRWQAEATREMCVTVCAVLSLEH